MEEKPRTRMVEVPLVECVVPIIAAPGDKLLIWQGVCLGVDTSRAEGTRLMLPAPEVPDKRPSKPTSAAKAEGRGKGRAKGGRPKVRATRSRGTPYEEFRSALVDALGKRGPMQRKDIMAWAKAELGLHIIDHHLARIAATRDKDIAKVVSPNLSNAHGRFRYMLRSPQIAVA